ncbi:DNA polymerase nu [Salvelinus alpinus]
MERYSSSSNRLYSGPLSASGQKILAALRAQSHNRYSDTARAQSYRQHERYGSRPREYQSEASWSRGTHEKRRGREADRPWSRPQSYSQSSSSWDPSSQRDYSQTPALSQDSASSSTHRVRYPLALHTPSNEPHWRDAPEETEPTFSLHFALEDQGHSRPPLPRAEHPRPHREKPTGACGPPFSRANVSIAPKNHVKNLETQSEGWHLGSGDGEWQCPERSQEETSIAPEDQREMLAKAKPIEVALAGGGDADHRAPVPITKWQFGSIVLPPPQRAYKAEEKADCDKKRPARGLLLPALESDFTMKDMDSGPSFELRVEDDIGESCALEKDSFGASHTVERDGFRASHALERDGFGASQGLETDDFGASHTVERDGFRASHALERDGFGTSQGLETDDFGASHTVERDGFGASHSMERDGFGASHSLKRDGFGASHALQRDGVGEKLLFNEGDVTKGHRDSTESPCVVGLVDQQGALHGDTAQSKEEIVTGGGPKENLSERDPIMRKRLFADMTTDNQRGMGGGEMEGRVERERKDDINKGGMKKKIERKNSSSSTKPHQQRKVSPSLWQMRDGEGQGVTERDSHPEERRKMDGPLVTAAQRNSGGNTEPLAAGHFIPKPSQESGRVFRAPPLRGTCLGQTPLVTNHHNNTQAGVGGSRERGLSIDPALTKPSLAGHGRAAGLGSSLTSIRASGEEESSGHHPLPSAQQPPLTPTFSIKSKHGAPLSKIALFRRPVKWEPPQSCQEKARTLQGGQKWCKTQTPKHPALTPAFSLDPRAKTKTLHKTEGTKSVALTPNPPHRPPANSVRPRQGVTKGERGLESTRDHSSSDTPQHRSSKTPKPPKLKRAKPGPNQGQLTPETEPEGESGAGDLQAQSNQSKTCLTTAMISDPRVRDAGKLSPEERGRVLEEAGQASALVLTMVYQDGTTQMDPEQKLSPSVCGVLVMLKRDLDQTGPVPGPEEGVAQRDSLVYLRLEQKPAWAQSHQDHNLDLFNREMLLQVVSGSQLVVCYKAKDLLRTALQHYRPDLHWKQFSSCRVQDPQVAAWLLDPADPSSCFTNLLTKHCRTPPRTPTPALGARKVSQVITSLSLLYRLNMELRSKLQSQGLWELYSNMELTMIPVLAAMESHRIHVDTESLKTTSEMLGTKMKQLEHEAHQAAGQMFLVSSSTQLRTVLFEKLRLQERCENKKLPKTLNKQQQSTSEAVLLQLQDLHPLPKIILEYRQVHKIKSTFVDGVLSCMMSKNFISSTWYQTSAVTGRISAKHPNFQALPRQPVQITKKQYVQGKEAEVVTVHPRAMFIPQDGYTFLAADFCQVELRLLAHLSSDPELQRIFNNPQADVFTMLASQWKSVSEGEVSSEDREHAKRIVYSVVYGAGRERLSGILGVSAEQASHFQDSFLHTYREVQTFIHTTIQQCHKRGYVVSIMGRRRTLPHIHSTDWGVRMQAERQAVNFVVQGSAADLCKMAMIRIFSQVSSSSSLSARLIAQLHDELLYEVEDSQVGEFAVLVKNTMESLQHIDCLGVHLKVPLKVAVSSGKSWGSMSELHLPQTSLPPSS